MSARQEQKAEAFRALHEGEPFVIPNPWDAGSARMLEALGFQALATTSSGFAFTLGKLDGKVSLDEVAAHVAALDAATELPVSVDLENGYAASADHAAAAIRRVATAGAVGGSIEDWDPVEQRIYDFDHAVERVGAAATVAIELGFPFTFTARAENHIRGRDDLDDTIARLQAFERAGADVLYAPGLRALDEIRTACDAVSKPVNVLAVPSLSLAEMAEAGAQRISVGGALTWVAVKAAAGPSSVRLGVVRRQRRQADEAGRPDQVDDPAGGRDPRPFELLAVVDMPDERVVERGRVVGDHVPGRRETTDHHQVAVRALDRGVQLVRLPRDRRDERDARLDERLGLAQVVQGGDVTDQAAGGCVRRVERPVAGAVVVVVVD